MLSNYAIFNNAIYYIIDAIYSTFSNICDFRRNISSEYLTFSTVRLCLNIGAQPVHLSFKANCAPIVINASNSTELCTHTGTYNKVYT